MSTAFALPKKQSVNTEKPCYNSGGHFFLSSSIPPRWGGFALYFVSPNLQFLKVASSKLCTTSAHAKPAAHTATSPGGRILIAIIIIGMRYASLTSVPTIGAWLIYARCAMILRYGHQYAPHSQPITGTRTVFTRSKSGDTATPLAQPIPAAMQVCQPQPKVAAPAITTGARMRQAGL